MKATLTIKQVLKAEHSVALPKLQTAIKTAHVLVQHVFLSNRLSVDIISEKGPELYLQVWKAFYGALRAKININSFHFHFTTIQ